MSRTEEHSTAEAREIVLEELEARDFYGTHNRYFNSIRSYFPELKITARGDRILIHGPEAQQRLFAEKLNLLLEHFHRYNSLSEQAIERIMLEGGEEKEINGKHEALLHGTNGQLIRARTRNQKRMVHSIEENDMLFAIGPAGTGKTYTAVALAVKALKEREVKRIILTRPAVEAGENLGFLPGDLREKLDPYLQPLYDALREMIPPEKLASYMENQTIQIAPLAFMRGRTLDRAFVILDEAQNTTLGQMKMFLTRMGESAKFVVTGDMSQVDLPRNQKSGLRAAENILRAVEGVSFVHLDEMDVIRHRLVKKIIRAFEENDDQASGNQVK